MVPKVLVPLAQGCEELEAVTIIDLLRRAAIEVVAASLLPGPVTCSRGTVIVADTTLDKVLTDEFDMIVLPGGLPGADNLDADPRIHQLIHSLVKKRKYVAAICAAPKVLANAGVLEGKQATSYPGHLDKMALPTVTYLNRPVVTDGQIITSRGPGTAMDFALTLIETLTDSATRDRVESGLVRT